jgi:NADP-dependent 3-hydroxy acid dehydrogenase YdfG
VDRRRLQRHRRGAGRALAARGAWVALSARRREALEDIAAACGGEALVEPMDVTCPEDFERVRERLLAAWGRLDLVVFNAGTYRPLRAGELTPQAIRDTLHTNLLGMMDGVAAVVPLFTRQGAAGWRWWAAWPATAACPRPPCMGRARRR